MPAEILLDARLELAEGPAWDAEAGILYFVDIPAGGLHRYRPADGSHEALDMGEKIGCLAPAAGDGLILALRSGIWHYDQRSGAKELLCAPEADLPGNRFNDGKCDPAGRFLAGSMDDTDQAASGSLYSFSRQGLRVLLTGLGISNGLTWSPDGRIFYFIDTPTRRVMAYEYDLESGAIGEGRTALQVPKALGWPDGMTSDREGMLWVSLWGGAQVTRWDPSSGQLLAAEHIPALNVSSCIFGGEAMSDLYITTARQGLTPAQLAETPLSGGLFRLHTSTTGMPTFRFEK